MRVHHEKLVDPGDYRIYVDYKPVADFDTRTFALTFTAPILDIEVVHVVQEECRRLLKQEQGPLLHF